ncbi:MAG: methyl-accepting chemotaxis protein McpH, partial [Pseudomonadota bacterium]
MAKPLRKLFSLIGANRNADIASEYRSLVSAIQRSQAVIEFTLDGTILTANENFLSLMNYRLDEVQGQHHRMFVESAFANSSFYRDFWERLRRGEFFSDQFKRLAKGGREVWIQASYNPVFDDHGRPYKIVKFATDITASSLKAAEAESQLRAVGRSQAVIEFDLDGIILSANDNFLTLMGYRAEEIRGQHHRLFVSADDRVGDEYRRFWDALHRGEYHSGQFRRIAKGGREVWIQASYNPIFDMNGKPIKIVKFATDITEQRVVDRLNAVFKSALDSVISNVMVADEGNNIIYMNRAVTELMTRNERDFRTDLPQFNAAKLVGANIDIFHKNPAHQRGML